MMDENRGLPGGRDPAIGSAGLTKNTVPEILINLPDVDGSLVSEVIMVLRHLRLLHHGRGSTSQTCRRVTPISGRTLEEITC